MHHNLACVASVTIMAYITVVRQSPTKHVLDNIIKPVSQQSTIRIALRLHLSTLQSQTLHFSIDNHP